jgi:hypothetical protein
MTLEDTEIDALLQLTTTLSLIKANKEHDGKIITITGTSKDIYFSIVYEKRIIEAIAELKKLAGVTFDTLKTIHRDLLAIGASDLPIVY